jgi:decaprenylphospho-beta-D-ribofuranose 2-oxidase
MVAWARKNFTGWGRVTQAESLAARPERMAEVARAMAEAGDDTLLAFGAGRSYGDTAINSRGRTLITRRLDRVLELDPARRTLVAEPGVTFREMIDVCLRAGFKPPVVPGTGFATLGGGIANDVHGKNHHQAGSLGQHIEWLDLRLPGGELRRVTPTGNDTLFRATIGGLGLTGVIERACIRVAAASSDAVEVRKRRIRDLDDFLAAFAAERDRSHYVVGWIDALAKGRGLGRGILETAVVMAPVSVGPSKRAAKRVPIDFPGFALNSMSVRAFNWLYGRHVPKAGSSAIVPYTDFLFPLDAVHDWNRIYGKRGFRQFQCVVPFETGRVALQQLLTTIAAANRGSFLAVLKAMGPQGVGYLSFPMPGYTLALDFPNTSGVAEFIGTLEDIVCDHGGRVYLAKDSTLSAARFARMYPLANEYRRALAELDPQGRMRSDLAVRLGLRS